MGTRRPFCPGKSGVAWDHGLEPCGTVGTSLERSDAAPFFTFGSCASSAPTRPPGGGCLGSYRSRVAVARDATDAAATPYRVASLRSSRDEAPSGAWTFMWHRGGLGVASGWSRQDQIEASAILNMLRKSR